MADEISVLPGKAYRLLFLYSIISPFEYPPGSATNAVIQDSANMPEDALALLTQAEIDSINNGTLAWDIINFSGHEGMTNTELKERGQEIYTSRKVVFEATYNEVYNTRVGQRFDENGL